MNTKSVVELEPVSSDQRPLNQALAMLRSAALTTLTRDLNAEDAYALVEDVLIRVLRYEPPADGLRRWKTLLNQLSDYIRWGDMGPNWDERELTEDDWKQTVDNELAGIAGRPL